MKLVVCPARRLDATLARHAPSNFVSLLSPGAPKPCLSRFDATRRLDLRFNDIDGPRCGLVPADRGMVERLLDFSGRWTGQAPLLVHCHAGVSRSTAAAYVLACARSPHRTEVSLAAALRAASPSATPNPLVVALADAILGREGRMIAAIAALGRGAECFEGEPFALVL